MAPSHSRSTKNFNLENIQGKFKKSSKTTKDEIKSRKKTISRSTPIRPVKNDLTRERLDLLYGLKRNIKTIHQANIQFYGNGRKH